MKVLKFGGTSVGSVEGIKALMEVLIEETLITPEVTIVTSAMSGVTNLLIQMANQASRGESYSGSLKEIESRHFDVVKTLVPMLNQNPIITRLKLNFNALEELLQGVHSLQELTPKTLDTILSYGERSSTFMISKIAEQYFKNVQYVDATVLLRTDSSFGNAKVNFDESNALIQQFYGEHVGQLVFVTGFIAANDQGQVTTLGRGGSDYTAAILGAALNCTEIQVWTDVNGMMTADPRIVKKAFSLDEVSYTEAMELSYFGAKVIYPPTLIPAFQKRIPILIRNTFEPSFPGTVISHESKPSSGIIKGISSINDIGIISMEGGGMVGKAGFSGRLFSLLAREQINVVLITQSSSEHSITFALSPTDLVKAQQLIEQEFELELQTKKLDPVKTEHNLSVLAIVGENMKHTTGIAGKLFYALGRNGVNVVAIAQGCSEYNISVIIYKKDLSKALNTVHDAFFAELQKTIHVFCVGTGNIGKALFRQVDGHADFLSENNALQVKIMGFCNTRKMLLATNEQSLEGSFEELQAQAEPADLQTFVRRIQQMNLPNCVVVDNTASAEPVKFYASLFESSISVVTSNKIANSGSFAQYQQFKQLAAKHGADFFYETNVGAGLPIIKTLKDLMMSGDRVTKIEAILSGTISFIFNEFGSSDMPFHEVVKIAQNKGFTEPDPRDDLKGIDFMRKMLILARDAGYSLEPDQVKIENILPQACIDAPTVAEFYTELAAAESWFAELKQKAVAEGKVLRYIGLLEEGRVSISLQMVDENHPFYRLSGSDNIISFTTHRYASNPMVVKGPGAGAEVTAAGVFADIVSVGNR